MTTENLPAVVPAETVDRAPVRIADTDSWIEKMQPIVWLAERIAGTEFVPRSLRDSPAAVAAAVLYGREVGLPPMTALTQTHVIEGKPAMSAEAMRAMVLAAGHDLVIVETTGAICTMKARRRGAEAWTTLSWSLDMARAAGLLGRKSSPWLTYPRAMLQARCTTELVRLVFPDVIHGFRSVEELEDSGAEEQTAIDAAAPGSTSRVARKRAPAKKAAAAPAKALPAAQPAAERPAGRPAPAGPPLPGEDGYEAPDRGNGSADRGSSSPGRSAAAGVPDSRGRVEPASSGKEPAAEGAPGQADPDDVEGTPGGDSPAPSGVPDQTTDYPAPETTDAPAEERDDGPTPPRAASRAQHRLLFAQLAERGVDKDDGDERKLIVSTIVGREVESFNDLSQREAKQAIDTLARTKDRAGLNALLDEFDAAADAADDQADEDAEGGS